MKNKYLILLLILLLFLNVSCSFILGIKKPELKNEKQLNDFLWKNINDSTMCYYFTKQSFDSIQKLSYKPNWQKGFRPLQFKVFNNYGNLIAQYSSCEGSLHKLKILSEYPPKNIFPLDSTITFINDLKMYRNNNSNVINPSLFNNSDLNIIVYWGTWLGHPGKNLLKKIIAYKKLYNDKKINIIKVNVAETYK
ncbi:MAG: hypothetical protein HY951_06090 [Bacteroidia bacterium]|nr:hypothetical protein [Bacteroidia bacterium]